MADTEPSEPPSQMVKDVAATVLTVTLPIVGLALLSVGAVVAFVLLSLANGGPPLP